MIRILVMCLWTISSSWIWFWLIKDTDTFQVWWELPYVITAVIVTSCGIGVIISYERKVKG